MKLIETTGLPQGVLNLVTGPACDIVDEFLENPICRKVSFTGSTAVGRALMEKGASFVKHLSLELGGNAPAIVFNDADLEVTVKGVLGAKFRNNGQSCIQSKACLVPSSVIMGSPASQSTEFTSTKISLRRLLSGLLQR
jgi:succinate-semialdehyde dehydrogenase/glutarate-semialdehyde dehydrogenase